MIDGSFKGFNPPPHSSPFSQTEFDLGAKPKRSPVVLENFQLPVQLFELKKACEDYAKKGYLAKFFGAPAVISKITEYNNQLNDRILTLNRNTLKIHSSLEDLAIDFETVKNEKEKESPSNNDNHYQDKISSLEVELRQLKLMMSNLNTSEGKPNFIFWAIGITLINIIVTYGIINSLN